MGKEWKRYTTLVLLLSILFQTFSPLVSEVEYFLNKRYIAAVLCINKDKPKMQCNGQCYFARQLQEKDKQEQQAPVPQKVKFDLQPCFLPKQLSFRGFGDFDRSKYRNPDKI